MLIKINGQPMKNSETIVSSEQVVLNRHNRFAKSIAKTTFLAVVAPMTNAAMHEHVTPNASAKDLVLNGYQDLGHDTAHYLNAFLEIVESVIL